MSHRPQNSRPPLCIALQDHSKAPPPDDQPPTSVISYNYAKANSVLWLQRNSIISKRSFSGLNDHDGYIVATKEAQGCKGKRLSQKFKCKQESRERFLEIHVWRV